MIWVDVRWSERSPDGIVEAIELSELTFCVGVQWHPELVDSTIFTAFGQAIREQKGCIEHE